MLGSSRDSLSALQALVASKSGDQGFATAAADLLQVVSALSADKSLRTALSDSGQPQAGRESLVRDLFGSRIGALATDIVVAAAGSRWTSPDDFVEAVEALAAQIVFADADTRGELDRVEEEIFMFGRAADANPELQMALTNPALTGEAKASVVQDVLAGRAAEGARVLLAHTAANLRARRVDVALKSLSEIAASQRDRVVADVRVAIALTDDQATRLAAVLGRLAGKQVSLNVVVDPSILGGVSVRLAGEVIDGTIASRLELARRSLVG